MSYYSAKEMALRVRAGRIAQCYGNVENFMRLVEKKFIESGSRPINIVVSEINRVSQPVVITEGTGEEVEAELGDYQRLFTLLGYCSNCFRCREDQGKSGEHFLQVWFPHPLG